MQKLYLLVPLAPLVGAMLSGLLCRKISNRAAHSVTILCMIVSVIGAGLVFRDVLDGHTFNGALYIWLESESAHFEVGFLIDQLALQVFTEDLDRLAGCGVGDHLAMVQHDRTVTHLTHQVGGVGDHQDGAAFFLELADTVEALALEDFVANSEHFVDQQHIGVEVHGHSEPETHVHPARVRGYG